MVWHDHLFRHSWSSEDESCWLRWSPDFSNTLSIRLTLLEFSEISQQLVDLLPFRFLLLDIHGPQVMNPKKSKMIQCFFIYFSLNQYDPEDESYWLYWSPDFFSHEVDTFWAFSEICQQIQDGLTFSRYAWSPEDEPWGALWLFIQLIPVWYLDICKA